jgi:hypothetical protein
MGMQALFDPRGTPYPPGDSRDPVSNGPHAHLVVVVSDNRTSRFRLPQMIQVYVEMKAAE